MPRGQRPTGKSQKKTTKPPICMSVKWRLPPRFKCPSRVPPTRPISTRRDRRNGQSVSIKQARLKIRTKPNSFWDLCTASLTPFRLFPEFPVRDSNNDILVQDQTVVLSSSQGSQDPQLSLSGVSFVTFPHFHCHFSKKYKFRELKIFALTLIYFLANPQLSSCISISRWWLAPWRYPQHVACTASAS